MNIAAAALAGALMTAGLVILYVGLFHKEQRFSTGFSTGLGRKLRQLSSGSRRRIVAAFIAAVATYLVTGWPIFGLLAGAAVVGLPWLLAGPAQDDIALLEALDRWVRTLAAVLPTGRSITDALRSSRQQAPALLSAPLDLAVRRLEERWSLREALFAMADDLDSPDADAVIAALVLAGERGGTGATATLNALADSVQERLRARREIETERAKPRIVVRQVTIITLGLLTAAFIFGRDFFAPYATASGQIILAVLVAAYVGSLVMMRRMTVPRRRERILRRAT